MSKIHINEQILSAVAAGELPARVLVGRLFRHLLELCPECRREFERWKKGRGHRLAGLAAGLTQPEEPPGEPRPEPGPDEAAALLAQSEAALPGEPQASYEWARLAELAALEAAAPNPNHQALALALQGNGLRAQGNLRGADEGLSKARHLVRELGVTDIRVCARIDSLEASLRRDQRQLELAEELASRAAMLYGLLGEQLAAARQLIKLAAIYRFKGEVADAVETLRKTTEDLRDTGESRLYLGARYNLALNLHELGEHVEALDHLADDAALYRASDDRTLRVRHLWLHGKVLLALGDERRAERYLRLAHRALEERPIVQVQVGLDLCLLYLGQGRLTEIRALAALAVGAFESQNLHAEAWTAMVLFREAAERQRLSVAFLGKLARYLERAKADPAARFVVPS